MFTQKNLIPLVILGLLIYFVFFNQQRENFSSARIVNYYAPWCGFSKQLLPVWSQLERKYATDPLVQVEKVDCDKNPKEAEKYNVEGFPTILMFTNGQNIPIGYNGKRTLKDISEFIENNKH